MKDVITLYIADDHQIVVDGLKLLIGNDDCIRIVGYAYDGATARADIIERRPDLALIDRRMPGLDGIALLHTLRKLVPETRFVMLSMDTEQHYIRDAQSAGASGYLQKNVGKEELRKCLKTVAGGGQYFPDLRSAKPEAAVTMFTPRELEILKLVLEEQTSFAIAEKLSLSRFTVETHRKNIGRKTETNTLIGLINFLREHKIEL
ncbi:response regulator [Taibaiella koreensis]|uniref:response regulator n=1 Tax=Taibaiella koreensis TaxID=1268548 RepID=UPI000E59F0CD|nr:response regulator transcription factor [Taibaiella koreensis]